MKTNKLILRLLILIAVGIFGEKGFSQTTKTIDTDSIAKEDKRLKFGCGFGLSFVGGTNVNLSPNLTYKVSDKVSFGGGLQGSYSSIKNYQNTTTFGANLLGIYNPINKISTLLEFAELRVSTETETPQSKTKHNYWDSALFVGAGFNITSKILIGAKYNVLYDENESVYTSAIIPFVNITF
ncbi:hypothetical protein SAMN05428642_1011025 [Flaviramulus basaltis]|uniref:Outer membrane protein beta-barrel domain-containing protein n=1 Tax=Flaviramulus basaltis TaxID=369401 RepID=A0A1K2IEA9_9FLAO|nr:hypothetical protein [Flaviramulus basaltis]SFZ90590.1 hypothetical protein SAMN05428642_1011025 [Flaviramulus basaltis]